MTFFYSFIGLYITQTTLVGLSVRVKADLDSTIFAYDYCAQLAYIMTFDHPRAHNIVSYDIHNVSYECHVVLYREN